MPVHSAASWFESMVGGPWPKTEDKVYPFQVQVAMPKWRPSRHPFFEFMLDMGRGQMLAAMEGKPMDPNVLIVFPERYLSIQEQHVCMLAVAHGPRPPKLFQLVTQSPLIIGNFLRTQIRIVTWPEDEGVFDESVLNRFH